MASNSSLAIVPASVRRTRGTGAAASNAVSTYVEVRPPDRSSSLDSPIVKLCGGHKEGSPVHSVAFSDLLEPGTPAALMATGGGSADLQCVLWSYPKCEAVAHLDDHSSAITSIKFGGKETVYCACGDGTVSIWDVETLKRFKRLRDGHDIGAINSLHVHDHNVLFTVGDDGRICTWDMRRSGKAPVMNTKTSFPILGITGSDHSIVTSGIDPTLYVWDIRSFRASSGASRVEPMFGMSGHVDTVTGLSVSHDDSYVLSVSLDNTLRIWDIRSFAGASADGTGRCKKLFRAYVFDGLDQHPVKCAWNPTGSRVACGASASPSLVQVFDTTTTECLYKLPGHLGPAVDVAWHPSEPVIASVSADGLIFVGELEKE